MGWSRNEPVGPAVITALNQMLRGDRAAPAHRVMPTLNRGVAMAPDRANDAALTAAGLTYLDTITGTLVITSIDGDTVEARDTSKRDFLRVRNDWTLARGIPCFIRVNDRAELNARDIASVTFVADIDEAAQLHRAIAEGRASVDDLRSLLSPALD